MKFLIDSLLMVVFALLLSCNKQVDGFASLEEKSFVQGAEQSAAKPVLTGIESQTVLVGSQFVADVDNAVTDNDDGMAYSCQFTFKEQIADCVELAGSVPTTFDSATGVLSWSPSTAALGSYAIDVEGTNLAGKATKRVEIEVVADQRPALLSIENQIVERGSQLLITASNLNPESDDAYECFFDQEQDGVVAAKNSCQTLPGEPAIKFDPAAGVLAWTPGADAEETYEVKITIRNSYGEAERSFAITVIEPRGETIRLTPVFDQYMANATLVYVDVDNEVTDDDSGVTYSCQFDLVMDGKVVDGLPCSQLPGSEAAEFNTKKGVLTWQPDAEGDDVEILIRGEKSSVFDEEIFKIVFSSTSFGEIGNSALSFEPPSHDFSNVLVGGESAVVQISVTNISSVDIYSQAPVVGNENFGLAYSTCPVAPSPLAAGASCIVGVKFQPNVPAGLGTTVTLHFGATSGDVSRYNAAFALSGVGAGSLEFDGLEEIVDVTHNSFRLNWQANTDAVTYIVFRVNGTALEFIETILNIGGTVDTRLYDGLAPATTYTYRVRATDVFGVHDGNTRDITVTTLPNTNPNLIPVASPTVYAGLAVTAIDVNDATANNDFDADGDVIMYTCRFDNAIDGAVASNAASCTTLVNEDGTNVLFNPFSGQLTNWIPRFSDEGVDFEFRIVGSDSYSGSGDAVFSTTVQDGYPTITTLTDRLPLSDTILPGTTIEFDIDNVRFSPVTDLFMSYTCEFIRFETDGPTAAAACSSLPGTATFDIATGEFSWVTTTASLGSYRLTFEGTSGGGSDTEDVDIVVAVDYEKSDLIFDLQAAHATGVGPGVSGVDFVDAWTNLLSGATFGTLYNFSTAAWAGSGTSVDPYRLIFDGVDDYVELGDSLSGSADFLIEGWVRPDDPSQRRVIFSNGDVAGHGITLTNDRLMTGNGYSAYASEVLTDTPAFYWRFNEFDVIDASTVNVVDATGNDVIGRIGNLANTRQSTDGMGPLVDLDDQYFRTLSNGFLRPNNSDYDLDGTYTIETWFYYPFVGNATCSASAVLGCIFTRSNGNDTTYERQVYVNSSMILGASQNGHGGGLVFHDSGFDISTLTTGWHHLAAVADGTSTTFYIDAVEVGSVDWVSTTDILAVGNRNNTNGYVGYFDEFAVYDYALAPARITAHYEAATKHSYCDFHLPPGYWYQLGARIDGSGDTLTAYVNGQEFCTTSISLSPSPSGTTGDFLVGRNGLGATNAWAGQIAEIRAYSSTDIEILESNFTAKHERYDPMMPIPTEGLKLWLVAGQDMFSDTAATTSPTADGDDVALWRDLSGNGGDLSQTTVDRIPVLRKNAINGLDAIEFDGTGDRLVNAVNYPSPTTVIYVGRIMGAPRGRVFNGVSNNNYILGFHGGYANRYHGHSAWVYGAPTNFPVVDEQWETFVGDISDDGTARLYVNTSIAGSGQSAAFQGPNGISLGGRSNDSEHSFAQVAAVLVYDRVLSSDERAEIYTYLNSLYNLGL